MFSLVQFEDDLYNIDNQTLFFGILGQIFVTVSDLLKHGLQQADLDNQTSRLFSLIFYTIGWVFVIYAISFSLEIGIKTMVGVVGGIIIIVSIYLEQLTKLNVKFTKILFYLGFVLLIVSSLVDKLQTGRLFIILATVIFIVNKEFFYPYQRQNDIVDGPALILDTISKFLIVLGNSIFYTY